MTETAPTGTGTGSIDGPSARRLADQLALHNLVSRVARTSDAGTLEEFGDCWTEDAVLAFPGAPRHGRAAIVEAARARRTSGKGGPGSHSRHIITTVAVQVDDGADLAVVDSAMQWWRSTGSTPTMVLIGTYHDTARREPDGWRLAHRQVTLG